MDFGLNEEQTLIAGSVKQVVEERYPIAYVRRMLDDSQGFTQELWTEMAEMGLLGLLVDESFGGVGLGPVELFAVQNELGRGLIPGPFLSSAVLATTALTRAGSDALKAHWLPQMVRGEAIGTVAMQETRGNLGPVTLTAKTDQDTFILTGEKRFVTDAHVADFIVLPARLGADGAEELRCFWWKPIRPV